MSVKTKNAPVNGFNYRLRKIGADEGSYIFMRMMGSLMELGSKEREEADEPEGKPLSVEERTRLLCSMAFMRGLSFEDAKFARRNALSVVDRIETLPTGDTPTPVFVNGKFVRPPDGWPDLEEDDAARQQLELDSLVFSLSPFFSGNGARS